MTIPNRRKHRQFSITLDPEVFDALEVSRESTRLSRSAIIEQALTRHRAITLAALAREVPRTTRAASGEKS